MTYNDVRKNENKGFSLVELIVVIAIMAVLVAVLAPSLLQYVERSRAQKDDSAMGEVSNAIMLALADQDVYDEVLTYTCKNNYSSYVDSKTAGLSGTNLTAMQTPTKTDAEGNAVQYMYNDNARLADEELYKFSGVMRGVTVTFYPVADKNSAKFELANAKINHLKNDSNAGDYVYGEIPTALTLGTMTTGNGHNYLYNRVRATIGDSVNLTSQTYRNSPYTVFIRMGSTGGNQADAQDAIAVYGQWGGTNLDLADTFDKDTSTLKVTAFNPSAGG